MTDRRLKVLCLHGFRQSGIQFRGRLRSLEHKIKDIAQLTFVDGPHLIYPLVDPRVTAEHEDAFPTTAKKPRRSWLIAPPGTPVQRGSFQFLSQTYGLAQSLCALVDIVERCGPFDGVLGFSQGGAVAALLAALQSEHTLRRLRDALSHAEAVAAGREDNIAAADGVAPSTGSRCDPSPVDDVLATTAEPAPALTDQQLPLDTETLRALVHAGERIRLRFALLFSCFIPPVPGLAPLLRSSIALPLLVAYGSGDWQTHGGSLTAQLVAEWVDAEALRARGVLHLHATGHVIPCGAEDIAVYRTFLASQRQQTDEAGS